MIEATLDSRHHQPKKEMLVCQVSSHTFPFAFLYLKPTIQACFDFLKANLDVLECQVFQVWMVNPVYKVSKVTKELQVAKDHRVSLDQSVLKVTVDSKVLKVFL